MQDKTKVDLLNSPIQSICNVQYQEGDVFMKGDFKLESGLLLHGTVCRDSYTFTVDKDCVLSQDIQEISWKHRSAFVGSGISLDVSFSKGVSEIKQKMYLDILKPKVAEEEYIHPFLQRFTFIPLLKWAMKMDGDMFRVQENKRKVVASQMRLKKSILDVKESLNLQKEHID